MFMILGLFLVNITIWNELFFKPKKKKKEWLKKKK